MTYSWTVAPDAPPVNDAITAHRLQQLDTVPLASGETWWSAMIDLGGISLDTFQERIAADFPGELLIPVAYDADDRAVAPPRQLATVFARLPLIRALNAVGNPYAVLSVHLGMAVPERWLNHDARPADQPVMQLGPDAVVTAVIDDGIGIAHELFRDGPLSSRVAVCVVLPAPPDREASDVSMGRRLSKADIDRLMRDCTWADLLDEDLFYTRDGQIDFADGQFSTVALRRSHGTHVMGLAAGHAAESVNGPDRPILCSVLPPRVVEDTTGVSLLPSLCLALQILSKEARRFRAGKKPAPVVLNFSYGNYAGPHDGTSLVARLLNGFLEADPVDHPPQGAEPVEGFAEGSAAFTGSPDPVSLPDPQPGPVRQKRWLALPAGNGNLTRTHAVAQFPKGKDAPVLLDLRVLPDDRTASHVEMWMPFSAQTPPPPFVTVSVTLPFGQESGPVAARPGQTSILRDFRGNEVAHLSYHFEPPPTARGVITLAIHPTASLRAGAAVAPSGLWRIAIEKADAAMDPAQQVEIWIRRDETLPGYRPGGRQAFFANPGYHRFGAFGRMLPVDPPHTDCPVRRAGTLSGFACGAEPMVIAAYTRSDHGLSDYSAAGPVTHTPNTPEPRRYGPDAAALGDDTLVVRGVLSAGTRSGSYVRMDGTSVAAPRVARLAGEDIGSTHLTAREWLRTAVAAHPFRLEPKPAETRAGEGGIAIPVDLGRFGRRRGPDGS